MDEQTIVAAAGDLPETDSAASPPASPPSGRRAQVPRVAALEAGRLFHRVRVLACHLTLSGDPTTARCLTEAVAPALVGAVGEMYLPTAGEVERELGPWLRDLVAWLGGIDHIEELKDQQQVLDALTVWEREVYDLDGHRDRLLCQTHAELDDKREDLLAGVPEREADVFRLGELIESGAFPLASDPSGLAQPPSHPAPPPTAWELAGFGAPADQNQDQRLVLAVPPLVPYGRPWSVRWPLWVRASWASCGLPREDATLPDDSPCPTEPDARGRVVETLAGRAAACLEAIACPATVLEDRFRIHDVGSQSVSLDGQVIQIANRQAFLIVKALLNAPEHQLTKKQLNAVDSCKGDVSKMLNRLPAELRGIVIGGHGPNAVYYIQLPPRHAVGH